MPRIGCLKCDKFFNSANKKTNRVCSRCKRINNYFDSSINLAYTNRGGRHKYSTSSK